MNHLARGLAAAVFLLSAAPVAAAAAAEAPAVRSQTADQAEDARLWVARMAQWGSGYDALLERRVDTMTWLMDSTHEMLNMLESGDKAAARAWSVKWSAEARRRLAAETSDFERLSGELPAFPASIALTAEDRTRLAIMERAPERTGDLLATTNRAGEKYIRLVETAAAGGRPEDVEKLGGGAFGLLAAHLEAEIVMTQGLQDPTDGPSFHFGEAMIAGNRAVIIWMKHTEAEMFDEPGDPAEAARDVREQTALIRDAVRAMRRTTDEQQAQTRRLAELEGTPLSEVIQATFGSLRKSADVEAEMADTLDALAASLVSGEDNSPILDQIETLTNRRIEVDTARRQMLAQGAP